MIQQFEPMTCIHRKVQADFSGMKHFLKNSIGKKFLNDGCKLKITLIFRGRELSRIDLGKDVMDRVIEELSEVAEVEKDIPLEGRRMSVVLSAKQ